MLTFFIHGVPAPQGSKSAYVRGGRAIVVEGSSKAGREKHKAWRTTVTLSGIAARSDNEQLVGPLHMRCDFVMPRPQSAPKKLRWAAKKPDLDKLLRSTMDGLTDAGVWLDDAQVVSLITTKRLADDGVTGAFVELTPVSSDGE
jgi:crossover junction endodeoxyribonuclease RusA